MAYPASWSAPSLSAQSECTFFDPEPIELPENSDFYGAALEVAPAQETFANVVRGLTDPRFEEVLQRRELVVAGRRAVRVEARATGQGLYERGLLTASIVVERGSRPPLLLRTIRDDRADWPGRLAVLDRSARSLVLFEPVAANAVDSAGLPDVVARKVDAIVAAADRGDLDALAELAAPDGFTYTFGGPQPGGPAAYWRRLEQDGEQPTEVLSRILRLPYTLHRGIYVWPFAFDTPQRDLTAHERRLLRPLGDDAYYVGGNYFGWRAGIEPDGSWVFFVAGD